MKVSGDPISSVIGDKIVHGALYMITATIITWSALDTGYLREDDPNKEGTEWLWGHVVGDAAGALLAANKLARSAA